MDSTSGACMVSGNSVKDETDDTELDIAEDEVKRAYKELGHNVEFSDLLIQTSNIKVLAILTRCMSESMLDVGILIHHI